MYAEDMTPAEGEDHGSAFLLTAAASVIWVSPTYLKNQILNLEMELLKAEQMAAKLMEYDDAVMAT